MMPSTDQRSVTAQILTEVNQEWMANQGRRPQLSNSLGAGKNNEAIVCPAAACLKSLDLADKSACLPFYRIGRAWPWGQYVGAEQGKELSNLLKEHLHLFTVGFREPRTAALSVHYLEAASILGIRDETSFQLANVGLRQVLILADKYDSPHPEVLGPVLPETVADDLSLPDAAR